MPYFAVKDAAGTTIYIAATGSGSTGDPYVPTHTFTNALPAGTAVIGKVDQGTAGLSPWLVDGSGVTQPVSIVAGTAVIGKLAANDGVDIGDVTINGPLGQALSAASIPVVLPAAQITTLTPPAAITGFATAAKQPALGTAGSASSDVITVQGIASGTVLRSAIHDGTTLATVRDLASNDALNVAVTDSSGNQVSSFGGTTTRTPTGTMTRPADTTAYAAGDGVTTATSSASGMTVSNAARTSAGGGVIFGGKASKSATSTTNAQFRIWIYQATPTAIPNDNAAFTAATQADYQKLVGTALVDFAAGITGSDGVRVPIVLERPNMAFQVASGTDLIVIWEARAAYTPASGEVFRLSLDVAQD